ncbi:MAG: hypothetical protein RIQ38_34, partial [Pseudomonadota bacterium]
MNTSTLNAMNFKASRRSWLDWLFAAAA